MKTMLSTKKIIIALDGMTSHKALKIAKSLKNSVWGFKVNDLLYKDPDLIPKLKKYGKVFADVKLYDIPNTVKNSVKRLSRMGADIITVHASGSTEMLKAAKKSAGKSKIFAVTLLTSEKLKSSTKHMIVFLAEKAMKAGIGGVVCSPLEVHILRNSITTKSLKIITPGIRPVWYKKKDDQARSAAPEEALKAGADFIVIGRPITEAHDPLKALENLRGKSAKNGLYKKTLRV